MKKGIVTVGITIVGVVAALFIWVTLSYVGTDYYTQIINDGEKSSISDTRGDSYDIYYYDQKIFEKNGNSKKVKFSADHKLASKAYLKLSYNDNKGVISWEKVNKSEVPEKALKNLKIISDR